MNSDVLGLFGKHLLLKKLASGGMAEVFLARPASTAGNGRVLVIKRILPHIADDSSFVAMFASEIQICMGLNHPNIVQIHDFGEINGQPYIAMEFVEGRNLKQVLAKFAEKKGSLPLGMAVSLAAQAAAGLHYAHTFQNAVTGEALHVVHRDISPHNLLLSYDGNLKIIDFGIAKAATGSREHTQTGTIKGKTCYVSPEQTMSEELDARSDVFSLGVVLWELLTGTRLFSGDSDIAILKKVHDCDTTVAPPSSVNPAVPSAVDAIVLKALAKDREKRYATAAALQKALRGFLMGFMPNYTYSDVSNEMQSLFREEIAEDRRQLRELNEKAQTALGTGSTPGLDRDQTATRPVSVSFASTAGNSQPALQHDHWNQSGPIHFTDSRSNPLFLKKLGNRKVTWKHVALLAFYVLSIVGIKLDERYFFLDRFMLPTEAIIQAKEATNARRISEVQARSQARAPARNKLSATTAD